MSPPKAVDLALDFDSDQIDSEAEGRLFMILPTVPLAFKRRITRVDQSSRLGVDRTAAAGFYMLTS